MATPRRSPDPADRPSARDPWDGLRAVHRLCPDMRLGQLLTTIGMLGEDSTERSLWDIEDEDLFAAIERLAADLARRMK